MTLEILENTENKNEKKGMPKIASVETKPNEGWTWLYNTPKWHYFVKQQSLCRRWMLFTGGAYLEPEMRSNRIGYCKICEKKLKAMRPNL